MSAAMGSRLPVLSLNPNHPFWPIPEPDNYLACHRISQRAEPGFHAMHSQEIDHPRGLKDDCSIEDLRVRHICWVVITIAREICR